MRIIPAIDIIEGKCVRLTQGDFTTKRIYNENPLEVACLLEDHGIKYLHLVDLDGAKAGRVINFKVLEELTSKTGLVIDFGGGVKSEDDIKIIFESGARQISVGSIAVQQPELMQQWLTIYGSDKIILGADCKNKKIATSGWMKESDWDIIEFIHKYEQAGARFTIVTDIAKDGMLSGPSFDLYDEILSKTGIQLIASGGISSIDDILRLKELGCEAAIIGKAIYELKISLNDLSKIC